METTKSMQGGQLTFLPNQFSKKTIATSQIEQKQACIKRHSFINKLASQALGFFNYISVGTKTLCLDIIS
jgi:hypothetical protein